MRVADRFTALTWREAAPTAYANCYAVDAASGNALHHSGAVCAEAGTLFDKRVANWGAPQDRFGIENIKVAAGRYRFRVRYLNHGNAINRGISNGVKVLSLLDSQGHVVARRAIQMPHAMPDSAPMLSTPADILLNAGTYSLHLDDFYNMSYLEANGVYANGGGKGGTLNQVDIHGVGLLRLE